MWYAFVATTRRLPSYMGQAAASTFRRFRQMLDIWVSDGHGQVLQLLGQNVGHNILTQSNQISDYGQLRSTCEIYPEAHSEQTEMFLTNGWHTHAIWQRHEMLKIAWDKLEYCHAFMFRPFLISEKNLRPWLQLFNELTEKFDHFDADTNFYWICICVIV